MGPKLDGNVRKVVFGLKSLGFRTNCHSWKWNFPHWGGFVIKRNYDWVVLPFGPNIHSQSNAAIDRSCKHQYPKYSRNNIQNLWKVL